MKVKWFMILMTYLNAFYGNLYKSEEISKFHLDKIVSSIETKEIPEDKYNNLEKEITEEEVKVALFQMNKNKSPGLDGLTVEFYQTFWETIGPDILEVFNYCFQSGSLCQSMNSAIIRLIYKNFGNRQELKKLEAN